MRAVYCILGVLTVALGTYVRWGATAAAPWWLLAVFGVTALAAFAHGFASVLSRRRRGREVGLLDSLGRPPSRWLGAGVAIALCGWLLLMAGFGAAQGQASHDGVGSCRYYLNDHGRRTCIPQGEYDVALAQQQSMGFAVAAFFLGIGTIAAGRTRHD